MDPDNGINSHRKLVATEKPDSVYRHLLESIPNAEDPRWTSRLYEVPKITFGTIYDYLVDRKFLLKRVSCLEGIADVRAKKVEHNDNSSCEESSKPLHDDSDYVPIEYTRTLNKAYRFFQDGHVQNIRYHPMPQVPNCVCIAAVVLPSMRKDRLYNVYILMHQANA